MTDGARRVPLLVHVIGAALLGLVAVVLGLAQRSRFEGTPVVVLTPATVPTATTVPPGPYGAVDRGFPDATTTGVPAGVTLVPGTESGEIELVDDLEGVDVVGTLVIGSDDVTIRNVRVRADRGIAAIDNRFGYAGLVVEDVEVVCVADEAMSVGVLGPSVVRRTDISGCVDGISAVSGSTIEGNFIHDLRISSDDFAEGITVYGGESVSIVGNTIIQPDLGTARANSAIYVESSQAPVSDVEIRDNYLDGFGITLRVRGDAVTNTTVTDNVIGDSHAFGPYLVDGDAEFPEAANVVSGTTGLDGQPR